MGASNWAYFVPYEADLNLALQELRHYVFQSQFQNREPLFSKPELLSQLAYELEHLEQLYPDAKVRASMQRKLRSQHKRLTTPSDLVKTNKAIERLLKQAGEDGTHSILDINAISTQPEFGTASPLSLTELQTIFNTECPTRPMVEQHVDQLMRLRKRWVGTYIIVYTDKQPTEIYFVGYSGD